MMRGQETQSMPSTKDAFMSLTWMTRVSVPSSERSMWSQSKRTYLETGRHIDCALKSAVLYFFQRIHDKRGVCISKKWRRSTAARDRESTIMGQMDAYLLFLEAW